MNSRQIHVYSGVLFAIALMLAGCGSWPGVSKVHIEAAERLIAVQPTSCEEMAAQVDTLELAVKDHMRRPGRSLGEKLEDAQRLSTIIEKKLQYALTLDSTCLQAYIELGDYASHGMFYEDSLIDVAKRWYALGLQYLPANDALLARLGFVYETEGFPDSARIMYRQVALDTLGFLDTKQALARLRANDKLKRLFFEAPEESYLLFERRATYTLDEPTVAYLRLQASGMCKTYDYYDDVWTPAEFERDLDSASVDSIISTLQNARFLMTLNPFKGERDWATDFEYVLQWHLPLYRITLHLPDIEHTICVYGLGLIYGRNALADVLMITHMQELNIPVESAVMNRLDSLSALWERIFNFEWVDRLVDEKFGTYVPIASGPGTYRYDAASDNFMRISLPQFETQWSTSRRTDQRSKQDLAIRNTVFHVRDSLYALDGRTGNLIYAVARDSLNFPYFSIYGGSIYFGRRDPNGFVLCEYEFMNGKYLRTLESEGNHEVWVKTKGKKVDSHHRSSISTQFEQLIKFCLNNRSGG